MSLGAKLVSFLASVCWGAAFGMVMEGSWQLALIPFGVGLALIVFCCCILRASEYK